MPLSEQEQKLLDEMERSLYHNDADYVATVGGGKGGPNYTAIVLGALAVITGIIVLLIGVSVRQPPVGVLIGVLGFALMFGGALFAIAPPRRFRRGESLSAASPRAPKSAGFMDTMSERWERRQDERGS